MTHDCACVSEHDACSGSTKWVRCCVPDMSTNLALSLLSPGVSVNTLSLSSYQCSCSINALEALVAVNSTNLKRTVNVAVTK